MRQTESSGRDGPARWAGRCCCPRARIDDVLGTAGAPDLEACLSTASPDLLELGDPGSVLGREVELDALPDYAGPPEPVGGPPPEWGAAAAETPDPEVPPAP